MQEGLNLFACALKKLDSWTNWRGGLYNKALLRIIDGRNAVDFLAESEKAVLDETLSSKLLEQLIHLMLLVFYQLNQQCIQANHD